jgi:rod shape-determining protein MreD
MTKWLLIVPAVYAAAVLNSVVAPLVEVRGVSPDFLALTAVFCSLCAPSAAGLMAAGIAGALADVNAPGRLGVATGIFVVASLALSMARPKVDRRPLAQSLAAWAAVSVMLLLIAISRSLLGEARWYLPAFLTGSLAAGLYSAILALPLCWLFARLNRLCAVAY